MPPRATASDGWADDGERASPLAALVHAATECGAVDPGALAERLGLDAGSLRRALDRPHLLEREQRDHIARALGVEGAVVRAACDAVVADGPNTLVELLERTVAAVADDVLGRRVRLALLTTAQTAAAEAGRQMPPAVLELRRRVLRGSVPWDGDGGLFVDARDAGADHALLEAVAGALRTARAHGGGYDDLFAPLHDDALDALLRRATASARPSALGASSACAVTPPLFGRYLIVCSADATADQRRLALRRGLAHILLGHVGERSPLPFPEPIAVRRAADVFALADLVPFWQLHDWRRKGRLGWAAVMSQVSPIAVAVAGDWDRARADDAARLRVLLYRERGL